jgi:PhzF family phenazine biosynthesis protein
VKAIPILRVDAFADRPFAGNPAAVVLDAARLGAAEMQRIAAAMRVAGTAFVSPAARGDAHRSLRMFTPARVGVGGRAVTVRAGSLRLP